MYGYMIRERYAIEYIRSFLGHFIYNRDGMSTPLAPGLSSSPDGYDYLPSRSRPSTKRTKYGRQKGV